MFFLYDLLSFCFCPVSRFRTDSDSQNPVPPGPSLPKILSLCPCPGTMRELLPLCSAYQNYPIVLETLPITDFTYLMNFLQSQSSNNVFFVGASTITSLSLLMGLRIPLNFLPKAKKKILSLHMPERFFSFPGLDLLVT